MKKKLLPVALIMLASFSLVGCTNPVPSDPGPKSGAKPVTETLTAPITPETTLDAAGWTPNEQPAAQPVFASTSYTSPSNCVLTVISQLVPPVPGQKQDETQTKFLLNSTADLDGGTISDFTEQTVTTSDGSVKFLQGQFTPTTVFDPTSPTGKSPITVPQTTIVSAHIWDTIYKVTVDNKVPSELDRDKTQTPVDPTTTMEVYPQVLVKYTCNTDAFNMEEYQQAIESLKLDLPFKD